MTLPRSALPEYLVAKADDVAITNVFDGFNLICNPNLVSADAEETQSHDSNCKKSLPKFDPFEAAQFAVEIVLFAHAFNLQVLCHDDAGLTFWKSLCKFAVSKIKQDSGKPPAYARNLPSLAIHKYQSSAEDLAKMVADNPKCIAVCTGPTLYFAKIFGLIECFNFRQFYRALPDDQRDTFAGVPIHTSVNVLAPENVGDDELAAFQKRIQGLAFDLTEQIAKSPQAFIEFIANEMNMDCANLSWIEEAFKASYQYKSPRSYASTWYSGNRPYSVKRSREHHLSPEEQSNIRDELQQLDNAARTKLSLQKRAVAPEFDSGNGPEAQFDQDVARVFTRSQAHYHNYSNACDEFECLMEQLTERIHWIASNGTNPLVEQDLKYLAELAELMHKHFLTAQAVHILQMVFSASNWKAPTDKANLKNTQSRCISEHSNGE
ncbi:MAG: hypothetical protein SGI77_13910 [Pirellulaceae bacterium]|nr:hypothetical protein [Pirellulaceae bacterium]